MLISRLLVLGLLLAPSAAPGVHTAAQLYTSGTVTIGGKTGADGISLSGTYQSANSDSAPYKVRMTVNKSMGDVTVR